MSKITIYGRPSCSWCEAAKNLADDEGLDYEYVNIDEGDNKATLMNLVEGVKTVPQIFVGETLVGGYESFESYTKFSTPSKVVNALKEGVVGITFTKENGETRHMFATLNEQFLPKTEGEGSERATNPEVQSVWDTQAQGWRSFRWDRLTNVNGYPF